MIKEISLCPGKGSHTQNELFENALAGLKAQGVKACITNAEPSTKVIGMWGWRKAAEMRQRGHEVLVFERGYLGDRFHWTSIGWNGLNGYADFALPEQVTGERFLKHFSLKPWRPDGEIIVIMGQVHGDASLRGSDLTKFYEGAAAQLSAKWGKPVYFRNHPMGNNFAPKIPFITEPMHQVLARAFLVVAFNSNSTVDAVINGVPTIAFDRGSMAWDVTGHEAGERIMPDREAWAYRLAHCQFSPDEIKSGAYWERLAKCKSVNSNIA